MKRQNKWEKSMDVDFTIDAVRALKTSIQNLKNEIDNIFVIKEEGDAHDGGYIFSLLRKAGVRQMMLFKKSVFQMVHSNMLTQYFAKFQINENNHEDLISLLDKIIGLLVEKSPRNRKYVTGLNDLKNFLQIVFSSSAPELKAQVKQCYNVHIKHEFQEQNKQSTSKMKVMPNKDDKIVSFWCFSSRFA